VVGCDHGFGACVLNAIAQRLGREATKHHRVCRANTGTGLHGRYAIDGHGNVDDNAVTLLNANGLEAIGNLTCFGQQFAVSDARDFSTVGFKNQGRFVA